MTTPATFEDKPHAALSTDFDGWFRADKPPLLEDTADFQMVPTGGTRFLTVKVVDEACTLAIRDAGVATIDSPLKSPISAPGKVRLEPLAAPSPIVVSVTGGGNPGVTHVDMFDVAGRWMKSVRIGVKAQIAKSYRLWALKDLRRHCARTETDAVAAMNVVEGLYLDQANVKLSRVGGYDDVLVKVDLEDPIASPNLLLARISASLVGNGIFSADFHIVSTWALSGRVGNTLPVGKKVCCVQDYAPGDKLRAASTFAHELCHAFGQLVHEDRTQILMSGDGTDGFQMTSRNIFVINP